MGHAAEIHDIMAGFAGHPATASPLFNTWPLPAAGEAPVAPGALFMRAELGAWRYDLRDNALGWTPAVFDLFGLPRDTPVRRSDTLAIYNDDSREAMEMLRAYALKHRRGFTMDAQLLRPDGQPRWMRLTASPAFEGGRMRWLHGIKTDITLEHARRESLRDRADIDAATCMPTRAAFERRVFQCQPGDLQMMKALIVIDVADIRRIARRFGDAASEACLSTIASRLADHCASAPMVARTGEHEFTVLVSKIVGRIAGQGEFDRKLLRLLRELGRPLYWQGYLLRVLPAAGVARLSGDVTEDPAELFALAVSRATAMKRRYKYREIPPLA
jgi:PAS domain S-box-containing protein